MFKLATNWLHGNIITHLPNKNQKKKFSHDNKWIHKYLQKYCTSSWPHDGRLRLWVIQCCTNVLFCNRNQDICCDLLMMESVLKSSYTPDNSRSVWFPGLLFYHFPVIACVSISNLSVWFRSLWLSKYKRSRCQSFLDHSLWLQNKTF